MVESSDLTSMEYDGDSETLQVWLRGGGSYLYVEVPKWAYDELLEAPSQAKYFHQHIKGMYECRPIE